MNRLSMICNRWVAGAGMLLLLSACGGGGGSSSTSVDATAAAMARPPAPVPVPAPPPTPLSLSEVGDRLFNEVSLSASGKLSCAGCHVQAFGHADAAGSFLPLGGIDGQAQGLRSSPSLNYLEGAGAFRFNAQGDPQGGLFWDGRADSREAQARGPLFNAKEMANTEGPAFSNKLRALSYFPDLLRSSNLTASANDEQLLQAVTSALAAYQVSDIDFHAHSSKFDAVQAGRASFTAQEARGLTTFNDPQRGNCAACHDSSPRPNGQPAAFTNFRYFALGVPRNSSQATADPAFFDLGLCGPQRSDLSGRSDLCGLFRVPTLRNVALTAPYFHNASLQSLEDVVGFYATRDSDPARWYPVVGGQVQRFNDLPAAYRANVHQGPPFGRRANQPPALSPQDVSDVVAFLRTLSDGFNSSP
ncbi:cytochrome-c peroxidase [Roseateles oligotrophus]|uniref:C-type cytochrome n=1 Tax=Roseateles oligotrophus TaxID=1769250 RepID=A0ABT2YH75_9BURK|nr:cytochrome c peroxidase [Roseateles oligotrophus]MCV2369410.1 c-type cytochrome [Roseateles oligotrophus]